MKYIITLVGLIAFAPTLNVHSQNFIKIDSIINAEIVQKNISGGVAYVYHKNRVVFNKAYGYSNLSTHAPMEVNSIFRIASQTKAIVSIAFLQLVEKGKIGLDDPIDKYIPSFRGQQVAIMEADTIELVARNRSITIRDLLSHQAGISSSDEYPKFKSLFCMSSKKVDSLGVESFVV